MSCLCVRMWVFWFVCVKFVCARVRALAVAGCLKAREEMNVSLAMAGSLKAREEMMNVFMDNKLKMQEAGTIFFKAERANA